MQIARNLGARVTGVCSTANLSLVQSLGAEEVLDYTREPVLRPGEITTLFTTRLGRTVRQTHGPP